MIKKISTWTAVNNVIVRRYARKERCNISNRQFGIRAQIKCVFPK